MKQPPRNNMPILLGIDGGGTSSRCWLAQRQEKKLIILAKEEGPAANPVAVGFEQAMNTISELIERTWHSTSLSSPHAKAATFGLAGAGSSLVAKRVQAWAEDRTIADRVQVLGDVELLLPAIDADEGIALIAGTGSLAWGRNKQGDTARAGGWGYLGSDQGSAWAIGCDALARVYQANDGQAEPTSLTSSLLSSTGAEKVSQLPSLLGKSDAPRRLLASFAKLVTSCAEKGDEVAKEVLAGAANDLAEMVIVVAKKLQLQPSQTHIALTGGVGLKSEPVRTALRSALTSAGFTLSRNCWNDVPEATLGAIHLAEALASKPPDVA